jgi:ubiquinone/menaquinone biosynthesis C-methylase UbiE
VKYYFRENARRYEKMTRMGIDEWAEWVYGGTDLHDFSSRGFLELALPMLRHDSDLPTALELGTGVGPGALLLNEAGYRATGYDLIPEAIEAARQIARDCGLPIQYEVMDATQSPLTGESFDLIVDSYCTTHVVFSEERSAVFESVRARLKDTGYFLVTSSVYEPSRHSPDQKVVDAVSGKAYDTYDGDCLYDPETDYYYEPLEKFPSEAEKSAPCLDTFVVNHKVYVPKRCYRDGEGLRLELASHGFEVIFQYGEFDESLICVHKGSGKVLAEVQGVGGRGERPGNDTRRGRLSWLT